jgi:two-component system phosphate regulon response regulator PhoB
MAPKILVVDDDKDILDIISYILFEKHYHVIPSQTSDIISYLPQIQPDLILLDNWLSDARGSELCKTIKTNPVLLNIPVILISAVNDLERIAKDCYADAFIEKPFNVHELEDMIADLIKPRVI